MQDKSKSPMQHFLAYLKKYCKGVVEADFTKQQPILTYVGDVTNQVLMEGSIMVDGKTRYPYFGNRIEISELIEQGCKNNSWTRLGEKPELPEISCRICGQPL